MPVPDATEAVVRAADRHFGKPRFADYVAYCMGDRRAGLALYQWNVEMTGACWETLGHLEVALRNVLARQLAARHARLSRPYSWLDDPAAELEDRARDDIAAARRRLRRKQKPASEGQTIAELSFGFWRFLLARRYTGLLWPDLAAGFGFAPNRQRTTIEAPVARLHDFRNRLAHHERIWNQPLTPLHTDVLTVLRCIDPQLSHWVAANSRVPRLLLACPQPRPHA